LTSFAKKENVKVLEKYINLWNPLNFVTREEAKRIAKEVLEEKKGLGVNE
ncbi:hypothetical protein HY643_04840, partial [Candidatus Woesearchaeota archaeon]|nr:hypothetical protein [Candidatus Woesearchaeota archaeon]